MRFFGSDFEFAENVRVYVATWLGHTTTSLTTIYSWKQQNDGLITIWKPIGYLVVIYQLRPACQFWWCQSEHLCNFEMGRRRFFVSQTNGIPYHQEWKVFAGRLAGRPVLFKIPYSQHKQTSRYILSLDPNPLYCI